MKQEGFTVSHATGTVQTIAAITIGPDTGAAPDAPDTWSHAFAHTPAPSGTRFVILHFQNASLPANNRIEVDLGYDTDVFTAADGAQFWTRPINLYVLAGGLVPIRYVTNGAANGSVQIDRYGRGERQAGIQDPGALSNSDPFLGEAVYLEPIYDPFWYCAEPPNWENVACTPPDVRTQVARSAGMMVSVHGTQLSTCTVSLVDADKVITAGHCITVEEAESASITFDYATDCAGNRPPAYNARFHKVSALLERRWDGTHDYALLQLATAPAGIPALQMRHDVPAAGEQVFGIHHPNGAVKKLSLPHPGFAAVSSSNALAIRVPADFDVSGGSSGSGLFDLAGRIVGVLSNGNPCAGSALTYYPTAAYFTDTVPAPPPPLTRDVMVVFDRSGSMSEDDGSGRSKIEAARDAVSLFVQLVQAGSGNRLGLVSFATAATSPADFGIANLTNATKTTLIGAAPYAGGTVGGLAPGGATSIGEGLDAARLQFPAPGANPRSILLLTDGMQNTPRFIDEVEDDLGAIAVHAIGFGTEANLQGDLLTALAADHDGLYMRAGNGLALEKFFAQAFGNIFEAGVLFDPEFALAAGADGEAIAFPVCAEEAITAVVGWDRTDAALLIEITSPGGAVVTQSAPGVEAATGRTWSFLRLPLPHGGERSGQWRVRVRRPGGSTEFPPPSPPLRYFVNVIPSGGPRLLHAGGDRRRRYYTGDAINPRLMLRYDDGGWPQHADIRLTLSRPDRSIGNVLTKTGLQPPAVRDGDAIAALKASLQAVEASTGKPVVDYIDQVFTLGDGPADTGGLFEAGGIYGRALAEQLTVEGHYTLHARASFDDGCEGARELAWSFSVAVGIDAGRTDVGSTPLGPGPGGTECLLLTITPRDRYGNHLGPGRADAFEIQPQPGTELAGEPSDLGNGAYRVKVCWDPATADLPGVGLVQPGRPPVVVTPGDLRRYVYSVKFVCGEQGEECGGCVPVRPGRYATDITIHNFRDRPAPIVKRLIPLILSGAVRGRDPEVAQTTSRDTLTLPAHGATMDDCSRIFELAMGARPTWQLPLTTGLLEITSLVELGVTAVYTVTDPGSGTTSIDVESIAAKPY